MKTLIVYDAEGYIILQVSGDVREPVGIPFLWTDIPQGKFVKAVDVSGNEPVPIFEDLPKSRMELLQEQIDALTIAMAALLGGEA